MVSKLDALRFFYRHPNSDLRWIANVFETGGGPNTARNVKALYALVKAGYEIASASFLMPYEQLIINGTHVTPAVMREMAGKLAK